MTKVHLIVFIHGFEGTSNDFDNAEKAFQRYFVNQQQPEERLEILKPKGNSGFAGTYDGIEKGAIRIWREVMDKIRSVSNLTSISFVGHSLGGLYARYVVRLLNDCFVFDQCEPRMFVTLATPHLSVRRPQNTTLNVVFQRVAQKICATAKELCMEDDLRSPLLHKMTDESFISVLNKFKRRILYSNVANDFQVHYSTASISTYNPYNRDPARFRRSKQYPDLTEWSLMMVEQRRRHERAEDVEAFAKSDIQRTVLKEMFVRLNSLHWERYDAVFSTVFAHEQIINKRSIFAGKDVIRHLLQEVFFGPNAPVSPLSLSPVRTLRNVVHDASNAPGEAREKKPQDAEEAVGRLGEFYISQI